MTSRDPVMGLMEIPPFALAQHEKEQVLLRRLRDLALEHYQKCPLYQNILDRVFGGRSAFNFESVEEAPFLPVALFKSDELRSVPQSAVVKVLTSSGTTGQAVSKISLDRETAQLQGRVLLKIAQHFLGKKRRAMVVLDHEGMSHGGQAYSARTAGILGMAQFGRRPFYALRQDMSLDLDGLFAYLREAGSTQVLFFGFTYMVWQYFVLALEQQGVCLDLREGILVHTGGWKRLKDISVDAEEFRRRVASTTGMKKCLNFYGMVEQTGSVYFENEIHCLHAANFSDIIIRDPMTLKPLPAGEPGLVQLVSVLPTSYPGHSLLTEDLGVVRGEDHPALKMGGRYFEILGRVPRSDLRGCSDTFQAAVA